MSSMVQCTLGFFLALFIGASFACAADVEQPAGTIVMLKLDDLVRHGKGADATVSPRWQKCTDFLEGEKIKANYGILCESLEGDCPGYVKWLKDRVEKGYIELWDHGYYGRYPADLKKDGRIGENQGAPLEEQVALFKKSLSLVKDKVGLDLPAFGPHSTHTDAATYEALEQFPQIKVVWFYGPPKGAKTNKVIIQRLANLEQPLFVPNPDAVRTSYEKLKGKGPYMALQGHPNAWDDARFEKFKEAVLYLKGEGCRFMTASEYLKEIGR